MLRYRLIIGPIMIVALLALLWLDAYLANHALTPKGIAASVLGCVIIALGAVELAALLRAGGVKLSTPIAVIGSLAVGMTAHCTEPHTAVPVVLTVVLAALVWHIRGRELGGALAAAGATLLIIIVLGGLGGFWLSIRLDFTVTALVVVLLLTKCGDIGAYFGGRLLGKHKLIPWLSPGKTWEGFVIGVMFAAAMGAAILLILRELGVRTVEPAAAIAGETRNGSLLFFALLGAALAMVGAAGDLMFSLFKRDAGVKDSSSSIPGFGGVLDVIDSPLLAAPVGYWLLRLGESMHLI